MHFFTQSFSFDLETCPHHLNLFRCITVIILYVPSLSLNSLHVNSSFLGSKYNCFHCICPGFFQTNDVNSILYAFPAKYILRLQCAQNILARVAVQSLLPYPSETSIKSFIRSHWRSTQDSQHLCIRLSVPSYLWNLLSRCVASRPHHSTSANFHTVPQMKLAFSSRAFHVSAPAIWTSLDNTTRDSQTSAFKWRLKTHLFRQPLILSLSKSLKCALILFWLWYYINCLLSGQVLAWLSVWSEVKIFAYGPADATATPSSLFPVKSRMVYLSGAGLPGLSWKKGR